MSVPSDSSAGEVSQVGIAPGVMALMLSSISASFRLMLVLVLLLPLRLGATAVRKSLSICNSFTLSMVILPLWVSVFQGPPGLETLQAGWDPTRLPGIQIG